MIQIRYRDPSELSPGLHAAAERHGRITVIYLLAGLTEPQRRAALRRLRMSARMGHCPRLPAGQLGLALLADRVRTAVGWVGAVLRLHPAGSAVPVMMVSGAAIALLALSTVSIRVLPGPRLPGQPPAWGYPPPTAAPVAGPSPAPETARRQPGSDTGQVTSAQSGPPDRSSPPAPEGSAVPPGRPGPPRPPRPTGGSGTSSGPPPAGTVSAPPASRPPGTTSPPGQPEPSPTMTGMPSASPSGAPGGPEGGICLHIGPMGVCLGG